MTHGRVSYTFFYKEQSTMNADVSGVEGPTRKNFRPKHVIVLLVLLVATTAFVASCDFGKGKQPAPQKPASAASAPATQASAASAPVAQAPAAPAETPRAQAAIQPPKDEKPAKAKDVSRKNAADTERRALLRNMTAVGPVYYVSLDQCEAAWHAGRAVEYHPTMRSKDYGSKRVEGLSLRGGEAPACADMDTASGRRWVFFPQGKGFWTDGAVVKFLAECQNTIHHIVFLRKDEPVATPAPMPAESVPCTDCNKVIEEKVTKITKVEELCDIRGQKFPAVNGVCMVPPLQVNTQTNVSSTVTTPCCAPPAPKAPVVAPVKKSEVECDTCRPEVTLNRKVPRTDGRCVVAFKDRQGIVHYARFDTARGTNRVVGAKVDNARGEWNRSYVPTYVGYIRGSEKKTVELERPSCEAIYRAISNPLVLEWTGPRLGLVNCTPFRRETDL